MSNDRQVFCLYADDIRQEVNNKSSLIGIYQGGMNINGAVPVVLPKLVISVYINTPIDRPFGDLIAEVLWDDDVLQTVTPPPEVLQEMQDMAKQGEILQGNGAQKLAMQMVFVLQPFEVKGNGALRVRVVADGETLKGNVLKVRVVETDAPTLM